MADISPKEAAGNTKLIGADTTGTESDFVKVSPNQDLGSSDIVDTGYDAAVKTVTTSEQIAAVGGSNLTNRKTLLIYNVGNKIVYYGPSTKALTTGIPVEQDDFVSIDVGENVDIYLVTDSGTSEVRIHEWA